MIDLQNREIVVSEMNTEFYQSLKSIGIPEALAIKTATSIAAAVAPVADVKSDVRLIKWMVTFNIGISAAIFYKVFGL